MDEVELHIETGEAGLRSLLKRAVALDQQALVRFSQDSAARTVDVFVSTPFDVLASRRIFGTVTRDQAVVYARGFWDSYRAPTFDAAWGNGLLPPKSGFHLLDEIPASVVFHLSEQGQALARQFSGPLGPPTSLLEQTVVTVSGEAGQADISMRMIFAVTSLGLLPSFSAPATIPRHLRVSLNNRWVRVDAPFGSVYRGEKFRLSL